MDDPNATHPAAVEETTPPVEEAPEQTGGPEPDPFAEVPSDPLGTASADDELPPGVQPGSLGGVNPSQEEAERLAEAEALAAAEAERAGDEPPVEEEFLEEPPEPDLAPPVAEDPPLPPTEEPEPIAAEQPPVVEDPPPAPPEVEAPVADEPPVAEGDDTGAEPGTPVGTSGSPPPGGEPVSGESEVPTPEDPPPAPPEEEAPPVEDPPPPAAEPEAPAPEGEPVAEEPKPEPKKRKRKPRKKKAEKGRRGYVILRLNIIAMNASEGIEGYEKPIWDEAFQREVPHGEEGSEPVTIDTRSGEMALRTAYRKLTENGEASMELVAVPAKLFNPKRVEGKVPESALTIKVQ